MRDVEIEQVGLAIKQTEHNKAGGANNVNRERRKICHNHYETVNIRLKD